MSDRFRTFTYQNHKLTFIMDKIGKILAVDDNEDILFSLRLLLKPHVEKIVTSSSATSIPELLLNEEFDVILLDMNFTKDAISGQEGFFWLKKILEIDPEAVVNVPSAGANNAPPKFNVPEPVNVIVGLVLPLPPVISPVTVTVPVEIVI